MITLKEFNILLRHLHQANEIFNTEAAIEEMKSKNTGTTVIKDNRTHFAPRSVILHQKANKVHALEDDLLKACDTYTLNISEDTIYIARELVIESAYPWIHRKEPPLSYMEELMNDQTFEPLLHDLPAKEKEILLSPLSILNLPDYLEKKIAQALEQKLKVSSEKREALTVEFLRSMHKRDLNDVLKGEENYAYALRLIDFRLYVLGLL